MSNSENQTSSASGELLSTFMDGEMETPAAAFFARRLSQDAELQSTWSRWHLVRGYMRDGEANSASADGLDLAARVRAALEAEEAPEIRLSQPTVASGTWGQRFSRPLASAAIAATVAMTAIIGVNYYQAGDDPSDFQQGRELAGAETGGGLERSNEILGPVRPSTSSVDLPLVAVSLNEGPGPQQDPQARARLEAYLLRHYWHTGSNGRPVFVTNVPKLSEQAQRTAAESAANSQERAEQLEQAGQR